MDASAQATDMGFAISLKITNINFRIWFKSTCLLSPRNSVGGDIVTRPFVGGWVSEWVRSVTLYLVDTIATTVLAQSLSNFTCTFTMMRGGTLLTLGHGVKGQGQLWHSVYKPLWARLRQVFVQSLS